MGTLLLSLILGIYFTSFGQKVEISEKIDAFGMSKDIRLANICPDKNGQVYYNMDLAPILYSIEDGKEQKIVKWDDLKSKIAKPD